MSVYIASESDISSMTNDFATFCTYLVEKKPKLSKAREELGKKDCFAINFMLSRPREMDGPKYLQPAYPTINLFFHIVVETGLFVQRGRPAAVCRQCGYRAAWPYARAKIFVPVRLWRRVEV